MELRQLDIFRTLAQELNFTRAARRVHCVQSNVSVQIRSLERELGVQLFERLGQRVQLTTHGQKLLPYVDRIMRLLHEATAVTKGDDGLSGIVLVGLPESVLTYRLPPVLQIYREKCPHVELVFRGVSSMEIVPCLERGELDLGLVIDDAVKAPAIHAETLCVEHLVLAVQPVHPLLRQSAVRAEDLASQTFLLTDPGCAYRSKLERALARSHIRPKVTMEFTSVEAIKQCAALGMGIACLPKIVVERELSSRKLAALPWVGFELKMNTLAVWHKDKWLSPPMQALLSLLRTNLSAGTGKRGGPLGPAVQQGGFEKKLVHRSQPRCKP